MDGKSFDADDERWICPHEGCPCSALPNVFHPDFPDYCEKMAAEVCAPGRRFFANTHTDHVSAEAREKGMLLIIERMRKFGAGAPIVFAGDHNCCHDEAPARAVRGVLDFETHNDRRPGTERYPSDHYPVTATIMRRPWAIDFRGPVLIYFTHSFENKARYLSW